MRGNASPSPDPGTLGRGNLLKSHLIITRKEGQRFTITCAEHPAIELWIQRKGSNEFLVSIKATHDFIVERQGTFGINESNEEDFIRGIQKRSWLRQS